MDTRPLNYPRILPVAADPETQCGSQRDDLKAAFGAKEVVIAQYESDWRVHF
jgi:hypothetical protein